MTTKMRNCTRSTSSSTEAIDCALTATSAREAASTTSSKSSDPGPEAVAVAFTLVSYPSFANRKHRLDDASLSQTTRFDETG
jgi:hypothetical protein